MDVVFVFVDVVVEVELGFEAGDEVGVGGWLVGLGRGWRLSSV